MKRAGFYIFICLSAGLMLMYFQGMLSVGSIEEDIEDSPFPFDKTQIETQIEQLSMKHVDVHGSKVAFYDLSDAGVSDAKAEITVVLLHGAVFSKNTWKDLGTLETLKKAGCRVVALDLPGFGDSPSSSTVDKATFLKDFLATLDISKPLLVSPSMSGEFALPAVFTAPRLPLTGWVPISPVGLSKYKDLYKDLQLPVLAVYGENDKAFRPQVEEHLAQIPEVKMVMIPGATHPCYNDDPNMWHSELLQFIKSVSTSSTF